MLVLRLQFDYARLSSYSVSTMRAKSRLPVVLVYMLVFWASTPHFGFGISCTRRPGAPAGSEAHFRGACPRIMETV
jgi:hypothetical protein